MAHAPQGEKIESSLIFYSENKSVPDFRMALEMADEEYLDAVRRAREDSVRFFSSENRKEREIWVATEFLTNADVAFHTNELEFVEDDPPDVLFRDARFEIKEILDLGRRRHNEFKASLEKAYAAKEPADLLETVTPRDITYSEIYDSVRDRAAELATKKYPQAVRRNLDLLFYVNLEDVYGYIARPLSAPDELRGQGWRSVSVLMGALAGVLMSTGEAPDFLRQLSGRIIRRPVKPE